MVNVVDIEDAYKTYALRDAAATTKDLLKWWDRGHRSMPWRRESTEPVSAAERTTWAYRVWVKGVGPYTAAAVSSIVYGEACPVVDGNVVRVVSRLAACGVAPSSTVGAKLWWRLAAQLVPADAARPGDANQAMMELGATVCTKANPACGDCPVKATCATHEKGEDPARYPAAEAKAKPVKVAVAALVLQTERLGKTVFALAKPAGKDASAFRSDASLYELPAVRLGAPDPTPAQLDAALDAALDGARGRCGDAEVVR
ncbi:purine-specific mismatch base pair DNA N-glycosylase [Aureococcus anophagefferens]|nr:purine-specific mismatch base pair DNA N-glycosylase [Aureococcus anophagefferens]